MVRRLEHYVGRRSIEIKVQGRRRERPKGRWLDRVRDDIKEKGLSGGGGEECTTVLHGGICHKTHIEVGI